MKPLEKTSKNCTLSTKMKEGGERPSQLKDFGKLLSIVRLKQEHPTCFIKTMLMPSQTTNTWEQSRALTSVAKLLSIPHLMRSLYAILLQFRSQDMLRMAHSTSKNSTKLLRSLQET